MADANRPSPLCVLQVKGKGNMRTYWILGRKISRRYAGRGGSGLANNSLAEVRRVRRVKNNLGQVVYGMVRARRRRTFKRDKEESAEATEFESTYGSSLAVDMPQPKISRGGPIRRSLRRLGTLRSGARSPGQGSKDRSDARFEGNLETSNQSC